MMIELFKRFMKWWNTPITWDDTGEILYPEPAWLKKPEQLSDYEMWCNSSRHVESRDVSRGRRDVRPRCEENSSSSTTKPSSCVMCSGPLDWSYSSCKRCSGYLYE